VKRVIAAVQNIFTRLQAEARKAKVSTRTADRH